MSPSERPGLEEWLAQAKREAGSADTVVFRCHVSAVSPISRDGSAVSGLELAVDHDRLGEILSTARLMEGVTVVGAWVNEGLVRAGDDIMRVMVGGDDGDGVSEALSALVRMITSEVVKTTEARTE